jgi:hypothetical protein
MDPNEKARAEYEPDDDLIKKSPPANEARGAGEGEQSDPTAADDGSGNAGPSTPRSRRRAGRGKDVSEQPAYGFWLVVIALSIVGGGFAVSVIVYDQPKDVATVMGVLTGIVGALVGAYFGVRGATYASLVAREQTDGTERHGDDERHGDEHRTGHTRRRGG